MHYYSINDGKAKNNRRIEVEREIYGLVDKIVELVRKFDGKVYNVKFDRALEEIDNRLSCKNGEHSFEIYCIPTQEYILSEEKDIYGRDKHISIFNSEYLYLCHVPRCKSDNKINAIVDKRINAEVIVQRLMKVKEDREKEHEALLLSLEHVHDYKERMNNIEKQLKDLQSKIPSLVLETFDLDCSIRWN